MKKQIIYWFLKKLNLPYHKKLFWQIKLSGKLNKYDEVSLSGTSVDIFRYDVSDRGMLLKHIELFTDSDRSRIFITHGKGYVIDENLDVGLVGLI